MLIFFVLKFKHWCKEVVFVAPASSEFWNILSKTEWCFAIAKASFRLKVKKWVFFIKR